MTNTAGNLTAYYPWQVFQPSEQLTTGNQRGLIQLRLTRLRNTLEGEVFWERTCPLIERRLDQGTLTCSEGNHSFSVD